MRLRNVSRRPSHKDLANPGEPFDLACISHGLEFVEPTQRGWLKARLSRISVWDYGFNFDAHNTDAAVYPLGYTNALAGELWHSIFHHHRFNVSDFVASTAEAGTTVDETRD